jgi:nitrite reductase/ring-hydroxylating ferredoxin subunit
VFETKIRWTKFAESEPDLEKLMMGKSCSNTRVNGRSILLVHHQDQYFAVKNRCPHQRITLDKASCEDGFIVCPWHRYGFDLKTGRGAGLHLENYPIEIREDGCFIGFEYLSLF